MIHCATNEQFTHLCKVVSTGLAMSLLKEGMISFHCQGDHWAYCECSCSTNADGGADLI